MTTRNRKTGRFTAERTTTTVTERLTIETRDDTLPGTTTFAPGWLNHLPDEVALEQREQQVGRSLQLLLLEAYEDGEPSRAVIQAAADVLRAGPDATPKELVLGGRSL